MNRERKIFIALACLVVPAIAILSFLPGHDKHLLHTRGKYHSWGHFLAFSAVGYVAARMAGSPRTRALLFIGAVIFGFGIEFAEHLIFRGALEWKDVLIDAAGVIGGTLLALVSTPEDTNDVLIGASE